jgi:hypothetical protein
MASSQSLLSRIVAAAAGEGLSNPLQWAQSNVWQLVSSAGWADSWSYARNGATVNVNPDTGQRDDTITDQMILSAVQALIAEQNPAPA